MGWFFTHFDSDLYIDADCPVEYGNTHYWVDKIATAPEIAGANVDPLTLLRCADAIIRFSQKLEMDNTASAVDLAEKIYQQKVDELEALVGVLQQE